MGFDAGGGGGGGGWVGGISVGGKVGWGMGVSVGGSGMGVWVGVGVTVSVGVGVVVWVGVLVGTAVLVAVAVGLGEGVSVGSTSVALGLTALIAWVANCSTLAVGAKVGVGSCVNENVPLVVSVINKPIMPVTPMTTRERNSRFFMMFLLANCNRPNNRKPLKTYQGLGSYLGKERSLGKPQ